MALYEGEILYEKDLSISKESEEKSNSLYIKSLSDSNIMDLLKDKFFLLITICKNKNIINVSNKSIFKIMKLFSEENYENILSDYITFNVLDDNISYKEEFALNNQENSIGILDAPFVKLLEQTQNYKINITSVPINPLDEIKKELSNYESQKNKININSASIKKICKYLNKSIYDISDYINILILYLDRNDLNKATIQSTIIDKYSKSGINEYFMGKKNYNINLEIPLKIDKIQLFKYDDLFENVLNKIDNIENNYSSDENIDKQKNNINIKENILNNSKKYGEFNIKSEIYNKNNDEYQITDENEKKEGCQKEFCPNCNIF
jgi:hypothetical protein